MKGKEVKSRFILFLFVLLIIVFSFLVSAVPRYCNSCANCTSELLLAAAGEVINLTTSIASASGNCIGFNGKDNVTFDCQNYTNYIQGDNLGIDYGIHLNSSQGSNDNTIRNCNITRFYAGVFLNNSLNNTLSNITSNFNNRSIDLYNSSNNRLLNITSVNNTGYGIYARAGSYNLTLNKISAFYNTLSGVFLEYSTLSNLLNVNSSFNLEHGVYLVGGNNTLLFNIIANNNSQRGVYLYSYLVNNLNNNLSNIISNNNPGGGIQAETYNTTFWNITSVNNGGSGIFLGGSNNTLTNINCSYNSFSGIQLSSSNYNNSFRNIIMNSNQYGLYLNQPHSNTFRGITANNNSEVGIYLFGAGGTLNVVNNATTNLNRLYGVFMDAPNNNFTNIVANSNLIGIYMSYSINSTLINITANSHSTAIYMAGVSYNYLANLDLWNCSSQCINMVGAENNTISNGKINLSSDNLISLRGDYNNFTNLQFFESNLNDIGITTLQTSSSCLDNAVPAVDSCFDLSGTNACAYFTFDCFWNTNGYCEFIDGITSCFDISSSGACSYLSDCSWDSFNGYCQFQAGLTDCSQIFDSTSCDSVSGCGWTSSCEGTISGGCSDILVDSDCEQGSDMDNCIWNSGYCKDYVGGGGVGSFLGSCASISSSGDCNDGTNTLCAYDNGYCKQNFIEGRGEGGFSGSCSGIGDLPTCNSETNDLCYWLDTYDYSLGNNFLNCSYNITKESVETGSQLTRKWYYRAYVNDTLGNSLQNFNVTSFNVNDSYQFNLTTDVTGFTTLTDIIDYVKNGSEVSYYSPYTIYAENTSLSTYHLFNASLGNNYIDAFTLNLLNTAPNNPSPNINSSDGSNQTNSNLNCYSQITDNDENKLNVSLRWYKNNVTNLVLSYGNSYPNGTLFNSVLNSNNLTAGDSWKCSMRIYDGWVYSSWVNSSSLTIISSPSSEQNQTTGGTGGSGSGSAQETSLWKLITPLIAAIMEIKDSRLDIIRIIINVLENVYNASLNITEIDFSSETHREGLPPGQSYKAFRIEAKALNDTNIANATIEFRVNRTWLEQRNGTVEDINLYRKKDNENAWSPLKTRFLNSDVKYHYFSSLSPGFSTFVVFFGKYECQPGLKRCYNSQSQLCLGNATWLITERCSYGCNEQGECIKTAPQSIIIYTILIAVVSVAIILTLYMIFMKIFKRRGRK